MLSGQTAEWTAISFFFVFYCPLILTDSHVMLHALLFLICSPCKTEVVLMLKISVWWTAQFLCCFFILTPGHFSCLSLQASRGTALHFEFIYDTVVLVFVQRIAATWNCHDSFLFLQSESCHCCPLWPLFHFVLRPVLLSHTKYPRMWFPLGMRRRVPLTPPHFYSFRCIFSKIISYCPVTTVQMKEDLCWVFFTYSSLITMHS